ncbi:hypothetical protein HYY71_03880 [Candidatus Woesearchaeota archaeon]|nr:hypothetical protein [Candidatus Woesearchaeota archaeon]
MSNKFYLLEYGWANKYFWFNVVENVTQNTPEFEKMIKSGKFTFSKLKGTTPADIHGSTLSIEFYSQRFIDFLNNLGIKSFYSYKIKFIPELSNLGNYYYVEWKDVLNSKKKKNDVVFNLKDWKNQEIFTLKGTRFVIVTEHLKNLIKKSTLENFEFEELKKNNGFFIL